MLFISLLFSWFEEADETSPIALDFMIRHLLTIWQDYYKESDI